MSVLLMAEAFRTNLPTVQKFVLVALCDNANDAGQCFPSISLLCDKCSLSERAVQSAIRSLEVSGYLRRDFRKGQSTVYWVTNPSAWTASVSTNPRTSCTPAGYAPPQEVHPTPAPPAPPPPHLLHPTPAGGAPITIKEPSIEPSIEPSKSRRKSAATVSVTDLVNMGIDEQVAEDFIAVRKAKKAPLTSTALAGIQREADKAGVTLGQALATCAVRGWAGFNAEWVKPKAAGQPFMTKGERIAANNKAAFDQWEREMTGSDFAGHHDVIEGEVLNG